MEETRFGRIVFIPGLNRGRYPYCNSIFIDDRLKAVIDPACSVERLTQIKETSGVKIIINTHYHEDHFAFNYLFNESELWVPELDAPCFSSIEKLAEYWGASDYDVGVGFDEYLKPFNYIERTPSRMLHDGDILNFGDTQLKVIHAPGHTPGHSCFYCEDQKILFLADLDLTPFGPWYGDTYSDIESTINSVKMLQKIPAEIFITSHDKGIITGSIEKEAGAYLNVISERSGKILEFLRKGHTMQELADAWLMYGRPREPLFFYKFAERALLKKHLEHSLKKGEVRIDGDRYVAI